MKGKRDRNGAERRDGEAAVDGTADGIKKMKCKSNTLLSSLQANLKAALLSAYIFFLVITLIYNF